MRLLVRVELNTEHKPTLVLLQRQGRIFSSPKHDVRIMVEQCFDIVARIDGALECARHDGLAKSTEVLRFNTEHGGVTDQCHLVALRFSPQLAFKESDFLLHGSASFGVETRCLALLIDHAGGLREGRTLGFFLGLATLDGCVVNRIPNGCPLFFLVGGDIIRCVFRCIRHLNVSVACSG